MASSTKRQQPMDAVEGVPEAKKAKIVAAEPSKPPGPPIPRVLLNPADCDLGDMVFDGHSISDYPPLCYLRDYGSHGEFPHYGRNDAENIFAAPEGVNESYGVEDTLIDTNTNRNHMTESYASMTTFPYNSRDAYARQQQGPPPELFATRPPTFGSSATAPYVLIPGSPYGTPIPRPSYGHIPSDKEHLGGYGAPRPGQY